MLPYLAEEEKCVYAHCTARARTRTYATEHVESAFRHKPDKDDHIGAMTNTDKIITRTMTLYHLVTGYYEYHQGIKKNK